MLCVNHLAKLTSGDASPLIIQGAGVGAVFGWAAVIGAICFFAIKFVMGLRVSPEDEVEGLDFGEHGNEAYHGFQIIQDMA